MAADTATLAINLNADGVTTSSEQAARALEDLGKALQRDQREANELQKAMRNLQKGNQVDIQLYRDLKARLEHRTY